MPRISYDRINRCKQIRIGAKTRKRVYSQLKTIYTCIACSIDISRLPLHAFSADFS